MLTVDSLGVFPSIMWDSETDEFLLAAEYVVATNRGPLKAPFGMSTDLASIPRLLRPIFTGVDDTIPGAIIHDAIYRGYTGDDLTRVEADQVFLGVMALTGVPPWKRWALWAGVRIGGGASWRT